MASRYINEIVALQPQGPYFLAGYCLGGSVAYEMAQQLKAKGQEVGLVILLETYNFSKTKSPSFMDSTYYNIQRIEFHLRNFLLLKSIEKLTFIKEKAKVAKRRRKVWLGMITMKLSSEVAFKRKHYSLLYNIWKVHNLAAENYVPKAYHGRIVQFKPRQEYLRYVGPEKGWDNLTAGEVEIHVLPVFPTGMLIEPFVKLTAEKLKICIQRALKERATK